MARLSVMPAILAILLYSLLAYAQAGPNTLARYNHNLRTMSINGTWFIVPIETTKVQQAVKKFSLGPVPRNNKKLFPNGFPRNAHPVMVAANYQFDIRRGNLEINALKGSEVMIPFVDRLGNGTPFLYVSTNIIGGANGQDLMGVVPAAVGTLQGNPIFFGQITPEDAAWASVGPDEFSAQAKQIIVPNPISGPGIVPSAVDLLFSTARKPVYTAHTFHSLINQPEILANAGKCIRNNLYFNFSFTNPVLRRGQVTLYPVTGVLPKSLAGVYKDQGAYTANGVQVGHDPEDCATAAKLNDKKSQR